MMARRPRPSSKSNRLRPDDDPRMVDPDLSAKNIDQMVRDFTALTTLMHGVRADGRTELTPEEATTLQAGMGRLRLAQHYVRVSATQPETSP